MTAKRLITASLMISVLALAGCGKNDGKSSSVPVTEQPQSSTASEQTSAVTEASVPVTSEAVSREDHLSDEEAARIGEIKASVAPDEKGFIIKDGILYDYVGNDADVNIPEGVTRIESAAFSENNDIESVFIPSSVGSIGCDTFMSCNHLKFVSAEEGLTSIGGNSFRSCTSLMHINLPKSLSYISNTAFWSITDLTVHAPGGSYAMNYAKSHRFSYSEEKAVYEN